LSCGYEPQAPCKGFSWFPQYPTSTLLIPLDKLTGDTGSPLGIEDSFRYHSIVGGLQYSTLTCLDISFVVNKVCRFLAQPTKVHCKAVKRIMRYTKGMLDTELIIQKSPSVGISIFTNAD
jgi:histone deacetylase 1/2